MCMLSHFSHVQLCATLWTVACQAPLSMEFSRQEYWSGLTFLSPGDLSDSGIEPVSTALTEKAMAPHSSTLAWQIPWTEEPGKLQSMLRIRQTEQLHFHFSLSCIGEGNGNPLQCSCLENPRDREAWWAAVYGVAQSRTRLK